MSTRSPSLNAGEVPIHEPGLDDLLRKNLTAGRLRFTTDYPRPPNSVMCTSSAWARRSAPTAWPPTCSYVEEAVVGIASKLNRKALIVGKSTVPVGTAEWVEQLVAKHADPDARRRGGVEPGVPARGLRGRGRDPAGPGGLRRQVATGLATCSTPSHKGSFDLATTEDREVPVVITDFATAELVKVAANAFLATKISFINAMAEVCDAAGADVTQLARAIGYDARIGKKFLRAGVGFGGGCLPKDIRAFQARAQELGVGEALRFLHEVDLINQRRRQKVVELAAELLDRPVRPGRSGPGRSADRRLRSELQAELRRRPRLAGPVGGPPPGPHRRRRDRLRPGRNGQRQAGTARRRVRRQR